MGQIDQEVLAPAGTAVGITPTLVVGARYATLISENADIRWRADGTAPTASVGDPVPADTRIEVRGNDVIRHIMDGKVVLEYTKPQLDDRDGGAKKLMAAGSPKMIDKGFISLQAESHPIEFRKIELLPLKPKKKHEG